MTPPRQNIPTRPAKPAPTRSPTTPPADAGRKTQKTQPARTDLFRLIGGIWAKIEDREHRSGNSSYYLILGSTLALTAVGLMMVLSSSAVEAISQEGSSYALFARQGMFGLLGLAGMLVISRLPVRTIKRLAWPALVVAAFLLLLVLFTPLGQEINGNRAWLRIGGFSAQPSELAKFALCLWIPLILTRKGALVRTIRHAVIPVVPVAGFMIGLVIGQGDLGTALLLMLIVGATLFFAGVPKRLFAFATLAMVAGAIYLANAEPYRVCRITGWLGGTQCEGFSDQSDAGLGALASGGWWGLGLGQSRQKWYYIPEAHNDFIFSILGEELGLVGTAVVLVLYGILAIAILRVIMRHTDPFIRVASGAILVWIIGQAFVNIGMVTGLLPVIGVPLPFISYGGTALAVTLCGIGVVLAFARSRSIPPGGSAAVRPGGQPLLQPADIDQRGNR